MLKNVTCWYKLNKKNNGYFYNHYVVGHVTEIKPVCGQDNWFNEKWIYNHTVMDDKMIKG